MTHAGVLARRQKTVAKLARLIDEMQRRDMHLDDVAAFLACSVTSSCNYMHALLEAQLVTLPGNQPCRARHRLYRLHADQNAIARFLGAAVQHGSARPRGRIHRRPCGERQFHVPCDVSRPGNGPRATRDPLVAALFGSACAG